MKQKTRNKKRRWLKQVAAIVLALCMLVGMVPPGFKLAEPLQVEAAGGATVEDLMERYPSGTSSAAYHEYYGNYTCAAVAERFGHEMYGTRPHTWSIIYDKNRIKAGDVVHWNGYTCYGAYEDHWAMVIAVNGDTLTIGEGNYAGKFNWGRTISKSKMNIERIYVAPGEIKHRPITPPAYDPITEPVISTNLPSYITGETAQVSWAKSSTNSNFYQYWLIVKNETENKEVFAGATGNDGDVNANSCTIKFGSAGNYKVTVYAVPKANKETLQKVSTKTFTVQNQKYGANVQPHASMIYNGHLYELYENRASVRNADETAYRKGGHLVNITSSGEQAAVMKLINNASSWHYKETGWYIGLTDRDKEGTWKWLNGEAFSYQNWNSGEPNNSEGGKPENYVCIIDGGKWNDVTGEGAYPYIVEYDTIDYSKFSPTKTMTYDFDKGKIVYQIYDNRVSVADAQQIAKAKGEVLTSITSSTEQSRINTLLGYSSKKSENGMYWYIGLTDAEKEGTWKWMNGDTYSYKYWNTGEPNNNDGGKAENYVVLKPNGTWNDVTGQNYYGFVTKKIIYNDLTVPTITTNREKYITNEVANISWAKTTEKTDFSNYWVIVTNVDTGEVVYKGNAGSLYNVHKNSLNVKLTKAGKYRIETMSCAISDNATRQKYATKTIVVEDMSNGENLTPSGTYEYNDHRYEVYDTRLDFMTARKVAKSKGGYLATITSQEEMNAIIELLKSSTTNQFETGWFIGLTDIDEEGNWKWETGEPFSYSNWGDGEPNNANDDEDCVAIFNRDTGKWNDVWTHDCYHAFIVEYNKNVLGDVNGDKNITAEDALAILKHVVGLEALTGDALTCADVNAENGVTAEDALDVLKKVVGLLDKFKAEM